jgi:paraquat-inducible protein B
MINNKRTIYFRIGSFVITGLVLLVIAIIFFGSGVLFKRIIYVETYFKESVQGLSEGSQVKYLGMEIGFVKEINSIDNIYPEAESLGNQTHAHYIYVKMAILPKFFIGAKDNQGVEKHITKLIVSGLRVKLVPQGLTGTSYLNLDFLAPDTNPLLPISWQPNNYYIPSATSTLAYFTDNAQYLVNELRQVDIKKFFADAGNLINSTNDTMQRIDRMLAQTNQQFIGSINNLNSIMRNMNVLTEQMKVYPASVFFGSPPPKLEPKKL